MEEKAIIFNGGRDQDIEPLEGADQFLTRLLGAAPSRPAVPYLRVVQSAEGQQCVGVFIGSEHVGYLQSADAEVLATVKACELNGAVARARGNLTASGEHPGKVDVRVNLADPEYLLCEPEPQEQDSPEAPFASVDESPVDESPTDPGFVTPDIWTAIESAAEPALSAGLDQDYPEWPPPKSKSPALTQPSAASEPLVPDEPLESVAPDPMTPQTPSGVSAQALLSTRSAWMGGPPAQPAGQTGWLGSAAKPAQSPSLGTVTSSSTLGEASTGLGGTTSTGDAGPSMTPSWQSMAEKTGGAARTPDEEIIAAWTSSRPAAQPVTSVTPVKSSRASGPSKTWMLSALAVVVLIAAAFLVWKFVFAPKTYTDDQYGYSFTYPGRWEFASDEDTSVFNALAGMSSDGSLLDVSAAGHGALFGQSDYAMVAVVVLPLTGISDLPVFGGALQSVWEQDIRQNASLSFVEPVAPTTVGGLQGFKVTVADSTASDPATMSFYYLLDAEVTYMLAAVSTPGLWPDSQKAFDAFFNSFKPGATQI